MREIIVNTSGEMPSLIKFTKEILERLEKSRIYGATLLNKVSDEDRNRIYNLFEDSNEFEVVTLDDGTDIRIAIKSKSLPLIKTQIKQKLESASRDIKLNRYEEAIKKYIDVLSSESRGTADTYANLGEIYAICGYNDVAIEFLSIAMIMDKKHKHYESLIMSLQEPPMLDRLCLTDDNTQPQL